MKLLLIHSDHLEWEAKKPALKSAPELTEEEKAGRVEEALVVFYTVEGGDEGDVDGVVAQALGHVQDVARQVKPQNVVLYPYAHLSTNLAKPNDAIRIGKAFKQVVEGAGFAVKSSPFGWYKAFTIKAKGHPLSELSRHIKPGDIEGAAVESVQPAPPSKAGAARHGPEEHVHAHAESEALKKEEGLKSHWYVLTPEGELTKADEFDFTGHDELHRFYKHETQGTRAAGGEEPAHVRLMRDMELVDYEPGSDAGNFRWYPKGQLVKRLLEAHVSNLVADAGGMRVETPIMYDYEHPALKKYLDRFPARQYILKSEDKEFFLRFAACFGQYLIGHDMVMSYKQLPIRLYELTHYSFRREQRGELSGLRRLRTFTMPDMHTFTANIDQAKEEFLRQFERSMDWMNALGIPYNAGVRFVRSFFDENKEFATKLAELIDKPVLIEMWDERFFYFVTKFEFNVVDSQGKASALSTVQIDVENGERFDITYADEQGKKQHPLILHTSISGSVDRNMYALLEWEARKMQKGEKPMLPFWLSPVQVRLLPVSESHVDQCLAIARELRERTGVRVDVDDRDEKVGRKIRDAEKEWVPVSIVYGDKEAEKGVLPARLRWSGEQKEFTLDDLVALVAEKLQGYPTERLPVPDRVSAQPVFRG